MPPSADSTVALDKLLETEPGGVFSRRRLAILIALILLAAAVAGLLLLRSRRGVAGPGYRTEPAAVGDLVVRVSATGNLQPTNLVEVGSELSGIVDQVLVDDNDRVRSGQLLARLDLSKLEDAVGRSRASLAAARAQVLQARATVAETRAQLGRLRRVSERTGGDLPSRTELSAAEANARRAEAAEASARASVAQARANLQSDETNLHKASIRSPIDGVVLTRRVETGQTVAAALQAPVLFTLAEDLSKMELQVDVDEADVGQVAVGQHATFRVDAYPRRTFTGVITRVGYGSEVIDGVVTYPAVIEVDNEDLSLRPGMTGTAEITVLTREQVVLVPNAALRFSPAEAAPQERGGGIVGQLMPRPPRRTNRSRPIGSGAQRVWVLRDGEAVAVEVETGATDGRMTVITGGALQAGDPVITEALIGES